MSADTATQTTTTRTRTAESADATDPMQTAVREVKGAIENVSRSMPEVARVSRGAVDDLFRVIETGSDERVTAGVSLSLGLALGMLLGSAPRLLVIIALAPVVAAGFVLADRRATTRTSTRASS
jgi:hypothetical protein